MRLTTMTPLHCHESELLQRAWAHCAYPITDKAPAATNVQTCPLCEAMSFVCKVELGCPMHMQSHFVQAREELRIQHTPVPLHDDIDEDLT
jgi:hypothetical protein